MPAFTNFIWVSFHIILYLTLLDKSKTEIEISFGETIRKMHEGKNHEYD